MSTASEQAYAASGVDSRRGGLLRRGWRKTTWALIAWGVLIAVGCVIALNSGHDATAQCQSIGGSFGSICQESVNSQVSAKVGHVMKIGFFGFVVLSTVWFMTRPRD